MMDEPYTCIAFQVHIDSSDHVIRQHQHEDNQNIGSDSRRFEHPLVDEYCVWGLLLCVDDCSS